MAQHARTASEVRIWDLDGNREIPYRLPTAARTSSPPAWALATICGVVRRDLTDDEWTQFAGELDRVAACP